MQGTTTKNDEDIDNEDDLLSERAYQVEIPHSWKMGVPTVLAVIVSPKSTQVREHCRSALSESSCFKSSHWIARSFFSDYYMERTVGAPMVFSKQMFMSEGVRLGRSESQERLVIMPHWPMRQEPFWCGVANSLQNISTRHQLIFYMKGTPKAGIADGEQMKLLALPTSPFHSV